MKISIIGIFLEGLLSFLSPCVLPLLPLYMSYLAGEDKTTDDSGNVKYKTGKVFITTVFFIFGICLTLTLLAFSVNAISEILNDYKDIIAIVCGTILIFFSLHELGIININVLNSDYRFKVKMDLKKMNFLKAFILGFVFSLGWSPCIGPMLANALMLVASENAGYVYIIAYGLGLIIPFLITGLLTSKVLNFINSKKDIMKWVLKIAGAIMLCFALYMIYNGSNNIITFKNKIENPAEYYMNYKFKDQKGNTLKLSDYKGKYIIIDFSATWCTYCKDEIPIYLEFSKENDDVVCLYTMSSSTSMVDSEQLLKYIEDNIELQVIIDEDNELFSYFGISSFPTKYVISPDGELLGYIPGALDKDGFNRLLEYAKNK